MNIKLDIEEKHLQPLIDFFKTRRQEVRDQILTLSDELGSIDETLKKLQGSGTENRETNIQPIVYTSALNGYHSEWPWIQKAKYIILKAGKALTTTEIADTILTYEPDKNRAKVVGNISAIITSKNGQKYFSRDKNNSNQNVYGVKQ